MGPMGILLKRPSFARNIALLSLIPKASNNETLSIVQEWVDLYLKNHLKCRVEEYPDLVYVLWAMSNLGHFRRDVFECVHTNSAKILLNGSFQEVRHYYKFPQIDILSIRFWHSESVVFNSGQKMALRAVCVVIC